MRLFRLSFLSALLLAVMAIPSLTHADVIVDKDTVYGTVIGKKKEPLPGAKVEIVGQPYSAFTDLDGRFRIKCDPGAKKVHVSYPKLRDVKKRIKPDMTVRIGRSWRQVPEKYQWFVGASIGVGITGTNLEDYSYYYDDYLGGYIYDHNGYTDDTFVAPNISIMAGRVKAVGWYVKGFLTTPANGYDYGEERAVTGGAILGGMVRLGCPLHLYLGGGFGYTNLREANKYWYDYNWSLQFDMGLLFRIKDNYGINLSMNIGSNYSGDVIHGSGWNMGFCYFFNK